MITETTGPLAELHRTRCRARDAIYDWARRRPDYKNLPFETLRSMCPDELRNAHSAALVAILNYEQD